MQTVLGRSLSPNPSVAQDVSRREAEKFMLDTRDFFLGGPIFNDADGSPSLARNLESSTYSSGYGAEYVRESHIVNRMLHNNAQS